MTNTEHDAIIALLRVHLERVNNMYSVYDLKSLVSLCASRVLLTREAAEVINNKQLQFELFQSAVNA